VCNAIQLRIFAYIAMGVFSRADLPLYIASCSAALVGMFVGCSLAGRTNQANFSRMLSALMVLCCVLMFASAAGVAGNTVAVKHTNS
jgi:FtsH-binding integral membrane protein